MDKSEEYWKEQARELGFTVPQLKKMCHESMLIWAETHRKIQGEPFSLKDYKFMEAIYMDMSREVCIIKSAQASMSEFGVNLSFWIADTNRGNPYIVFPTKHDMGIFVQGRIDSAKEETTYLNERIRGKTDNVSIKRFGLRTMYFTGSQKRTQIISSPADLVIQDEYDEHNPDVDTTVKKRTNNSKLKMFRRLSTPTYPGFGIHREYMKSSKGVWVHKCKSCKADIMVSGEDIADRWQDMIKKVGDSYEYCCPKCKEKCDFTYGKWVHRDPDNIYHGYSVNRMMTKRCSAKELMEAYEESLERDNYKEFLRSDLGVPYEEPGSRIYDKDCKACESARTISKVGTGNRDYFLGMDTGNEKHGLIMHVEDGGMVFIDKVFVIKRYEELHKILQDFNIKVGVIDNRPEPTPVLELHKKYGSIFGAEHNNGLVKPTGPKKDGNIVSYNRFCSIERVYNYIIERKFDIPRDLNLSTDKKFYKHLISQMKIEKVSENTQRVQHSFIPTTNAKKVSDHFLFATIYALTAYDLYKELMQNNQPSGFILL
jgi:hypothetical protein